MVPTASMKKWPRNDSLSFVFANIHHGSQVGENKWKQTIKKERSSGLGMIAT